MQRLREVARRIVEDVDTPAGRAFDLAVQALIVLSLVLYSLETLPGLSHATRRALRWGELVTVGLFTAEYLLRAAVAKPTRTYVFGVFGAVDLLSILPTLLAAGFDLRALRALRLLRLFRVLKLVRYSAAARRFALALKIAREELVLFLGAAGVVLFLAAAGIHHFEHEAQPEEFASIFHSLWWAVVTLTTVGYGDVYPMTIGGRLFTFLVLVVGLGVVSVPAGLVASALSEARRMEADIREPATMRAEADVRTGA
ncbi:ion transporter [Alienimonas chondri]|uniref:ion transporter n=1 Tax=Alienimonas chondri TaxID=2681879 RepID=UPI00148761DD